MATLFIYASWAINGIKGNNTNLKKKKKIYFSQNVNFFSILGLNSENNSLLNII